MAGRPRPPRIVPSPTVGGEAADQARASAAFGGRNYRRAAKAIDEQGGNATVLIQGRLTGNLDVLDTGIAVQSKTPLGDSTS